MGRGSRHSPSISLILWFFLHQIVVLDPEGNGIHDYWDDEHHDHKLELGIRCNPAHEELCDDHNGTTEHVLNCEEDRLYTDYNGIPNEELYEPGRKVYSILATPYIIFFLLSVTCRGCILP